MRTAQDPTSRVDLGHIQAHVVRSMDPDAAIHFFFRIDATKVDSFCEMLASLLPTSPARSGLRLGGFLEPLGKHRLLEPLAKLRASERSAYPLDALVLWSERHQQASEEQPHRRARTPLSVNIGFTWRGLQALGINRDTLQSFPEEFRDGMAARADLLSDTGEAAPENWDQWLGSTAVHGLFTVNLRKPQSDARDEDAAPASPAELYDDLVALARQCKDSSGWAGYGMEILQVEVGWSNSRQDEAGARYRVEHFGFNDGISQPFADLGLGPPPPGGGTARPGNSWDPIALGELLLGYPDEDRVVQQRPASAALRTGATYMAFRKLEQDVVGFRQYIARLDGGAPPERSRLAAQMIGRWGNGTPIALSPSGPRNYAPRTVDDEINNFRYQDTDPHGARCPIGAHIRRANPRDANDRDEVRRHRIWRRGLSYGGPLLAPGSNGDGRRRGALFIALNARLDQQFEFLQRRWLNTGEFIGQVGADRCPLVGNNAGRPGDQFLSPDRPGPITNLPRFVTVRGGDYFFVPSIPALERLAKRDPFDPDVPLSDAAPGADQPLVAASGDPYANPSLAATPNPLDPDKLFALGRQKLLGRDSPPAITIEQPFIPYDGAELTRVAVALIGRYDYVREVLEDGRNFSVSPYADAIGRITGGENMTVGMPDDDEHALRQRIWHEAAKIYTGDPVADIVDAAMDKILARYGHTGKLDVSADIGKVVPLALAEFCYGVPGPDHLSPTLCALQFNQPEITAVPPDWLATLPYVPPQDIPTLTLQGWTRYAFMQVFVNNVAQAADLADAAARTTAEFFLHLDAVIDRAYRVRDRRTLLGCMVANGHEAYGLSPAEFKRRLRLILAEQIIGGTDTLNRALVNVVNHLLDHPARLRQAQMAARAERNTELDGIIRECLRFDPVATMLFRRCAQDVIFNDSRIASGTLVCLLLKVAMFDDRASAFPNPDEFDPSRPEARYLLFGSGAHRCAGGPTASLVLRHVMKRLLDLADFRRAAGPAGIPQSTLQLPNSMMVRFQAMTAPRLAPA